MTKKPSRNYYFSAKYQGQDSERVGPLWKKYKSLQALGDGAETKHRLVELYLPFVKGHAESIRRGLASGAPDLDDLVSEGVIALMNAIDSFELARGCKFETYATPRIRGAMLDFVRTEDWAPRLVRSRNSVYEETKKRLEQRDGQVPDSEVYTELRRTREDAEPIISNHETPQPRVISIERKIEYTRTPARDLGSDDLHLVEALVDGKGENPVGRLKKLEFLRTALQGLSQQEKLILISYYYEDKTMKEIGADLDLSESRISQMHSAMKTRLKGNSRLQGYRAEFG
ncbi:MAG: sigma-70 family RNA polymerase sigma factor [Candidatus Nanoarchaeia archaeon]|nr:sigma-70 family RNA polymerase sigma factor [Candidatus Nanoarchaeia archaeon]